MEIFNYSKFSGKKGRSHRGSFKCHREDIFSFGRVITRRNRAYKWVSGCLSPQRSKGSRLVSQIIYSKRFDTFKDRFPFAKEPASGRPPFRSADPRTRSFLVSPFNHFLNRVIRGREISKTLRLITRLSTFTNRFKRAEH